MPRNPERSNRQRRERIHRDAEHQRQQSTSLIDHLLRGVPTNSTVDPYRDYRLLLIHLYDSLSILPSTVLTSGGTVYRAVYRHINRRGVVSMPCQLYPNVNCSGREVLPEFYTTIAPDSVTEPTPGIIASLIKQFLFYMVVCDVGSVNVWLRSSTGTTKIERVEDMIVPTQDDRSEGSTPDVPYIEINFGIERSHFDPGLHTSATERYYNHSLERIVASFILCGSNDCLTTNHFCLRGGYVTEQHASRFRAASPSVVSETMRQLLFDSVPSYSVLDSLADSYEESISSPSPSLLFNSDIDEALRARRNRPTGQTPQRESRTTKRLPAGRLRDLRASFDNHRELVQECYDMGWPQSPKTVSAAIKSMEEAERLRVILDGQGETHLSIPDITGIIVQYKQAEIDRPVWLPLPRRLIAPITENFNGDG